MTQRFTYQDLGEPVLGGEFSSPRHGTVLIDYPLFNAWKALRFTGKAEGLFVNNGRGGKSLSINAVPKAVRSEGSPSTLACTDADWTALKSAVDSQMVLSDCSCGKHQYRIRPVDLGTQAIGYAVDACCPDFEAKVHAAVRQMGERRGFLVPQECS